MPLEFARTQTDVYPTRTAEPERWLDRQDPVLWQSWSEDAPITRAQAEHFDSKGYLVLKDLFEQEEVTALMENARILRETLAGSQSDHVVTEPGGDAVRTVFRLEEQNDMMDRLSRDRRLAGIAKFLLADDVYIHQSRLNYKPGFTGKEFYWHSDFETWHAEDGMPRMRAVSASLLLTDNRAHNGALMLMPGSQNTYISCQGETPEDNHKSSLKKQEIGTPSQESLAEMAKICGIDDAEGPAGTLILFDCNTLHGSNGNITPDPRSNAFFVYNAVSNAAEEPFAAPNPRPDFLANRGEPRSLEINDGRLI